MFPAAVPYYEQAGIAVDITQLDIQNVKSEHLTVDGKKVLAVSGEVVNVSGYEFKAPPIRFILRDDQNQEVYAWTLNGVQAGAIRPNERTTFVTRLADPPKTADDVEIRFARADEIGSITQP